MIFRIIKGSFSVQNSMNDSMRGGKTPPPFPEKNDLSFARFPLPP
jgi:hypothetical protein